MCSVDFRVFPKEIRVTRPPVPFVALFYYYDRNQKPNIMHWISYMKTLALYSETFIGFEDEYM